MFWNQQIPTRKMASKKIKNVTWNKSCTAETRKLEEGRIKCSRITERIVKWLPNLKKYFYIVYLKKKMHFLAAPS